MECLEYALNILVVSTGIAEQPQTQSKSRGRICVCVEHRCCSCTLFGTNMFGALFGTNAYGYTTVLI